MRRAIALAVIFIPAMVHADPAAVPNVLALAEKTAPGSSLSTLIELAAGGASRKLLEGLPLGSYGLAVDEGTGRWAFSFGQLSNGDPLLMDGRAVSKPDDRNVLVFGDLTGWTTTTLGDPGCTSKKTSCFETPIRFTDDGAYLFVRAESSHAVTLSRWTVGKTPKRAVVTDSGMTIGADGGHAAYLAKDGVHVVTWPVQKAKAVKVKKSKKAVVNPSLLMSDAWPIGGRVYWFRREPKEQKRGYFEAYDLASKTTVIVREAKLDFAMMRGGFWSTGPRNTVVFGDDTGFERADVIEVPADGDQSQARVVTQDVRQILDVSRDGKYLLVTRRKDPSKGETVDNPERLVIVDLDSGKDLSTLDAGGDGIGILGAGFVPPDAGDQGN